MRPSFFPLLVFGVCLQVIAAPKLHEAQNYDLQLGDVRFDPLLNPSRPEAPWGTPVTGPDPDLFLVQMIGPIQPNWRTYLRSHGLEPIQYLYPFTYVVWGQNQALNQLSAEFIRWSGPFLPAYRVRPVFRKADARPQRTTLLVYRGADATQIQSRLRAAGATSCTWSSWDKTFSQILCHLAPSQYATIATIPGVYSVQTQSLDGGNRDEMQCQLLARDLSANTILSGYPEWLNLNGLSGEGVVVADVDSGIDQTHPDIAGAFLPCQGESCEDTASNHGTHTAAIIGGRAANGTLDSFGFLRGQGLAPAVSLVEQNYSSIYLEPGGMLQLITESFRNGAVLSSNSWGSTTTPQGYDASSRQVDVGIRDADPLENGNQPFSFVVAIMNGRGGTSSQGAPEEAKNAVRVGSTWLRTNAGVQDSRIFSISDNSAHGPALDGRALPDLVAPGKFVDSAIQGGAYGYLGGTSMAAPSVSGSSALFIELYRELPQNPASFDPSPALLKAALIAATQDLSGNTDADGQPLGHRRDNKQGWGLLNLQDLLDSNVPITYLDNPETLTATGASWSDTLTIGDPAHPAYVVMVFTDAPGHGLGGIQPAWNNDLDLEVTYSAATYRGNVLGSSGWSVSGGTADPANNVEAVLLGPTTSAGALTITVRADDLNSDGVPNSGNETDQDFALVCVNCVQDPGFNLYANNPTVGVCSGEIATWNLSVGQIGAFNSPVSLAAQGLPVGVTAHFAQNPLTPPQASTLSVSGTSGLATGDYPFTLEATSGMVTHSLDLTLHIDNGLPPAPALTAPLLGALDQTTSPLFRWSGVAGETFQFQLDDAADFATPLYEITETQSEHHYGETLTYATTYYWRVRATNTCGTGSWSSVYHFQTLAGPPILLVDDDDNLPDTRPAIVEALDFLGISYDVWDVSLELNTEPDAQTLAQYPVCLWVSGNAYNMAVPLAGPSGAGEGQLGIYLDAGGKLILSSQYYLMNRGGNPFNPNFFMGEYLGIASGNPTSIFEVVQGVGADFSHLGPYSLTAEYQLRPGIANPNPPAETIFTYGSASAGLRHSPGTYDALFLPWPLEALPDAARIDTLQTLLAELGLLSSLCRNEDDFQAKLPFWPEEQNAVELIECLNLFLTP